jgi:hypothetical protein
MATLIETVQALLNPLGSGGSWYGANTTEPLALDQFGAVKPYIVFLAIVSTDNNTLSGPSGRQNTRIQVDYFSPRVQDMAALAKAGDAALAAGFMLPDSCIAQTSQDFFEEPVRLYRRSRDYSIWFLET